MKKFLKIVDNPPFTYLLYPSYRTAILLTESYTHEWFLSSFIQFSCNEKQLNDFGVEFQVVPFLKEKDKDYKNDTAQGAIKRIIDCINENIYVSLTWDESLISCRPSYYDGHYKHMVLIVGYDEEHKFFEILGFTQKNTYEKTRVSFDEFSIAYNYFSSSKWKLFSWKKIYNKKFNIKSFNKQLFYYRKSIYPISSRLVASQSFLKNKSFGLQTYSCLISKLENENKTQKSSKTVLKALTAYYEHKIHLTMSFEYIKENHIYSDEVINKVIMSYKKISDDFLMLRSLYIKYVMTLSTQIIEIIITKIREIYTREKNIIDYYFSNKNLYNN